MTSNIGYNMDSQFAGNWSLVMQHIGTIKPRWCLTYSVRDAESIKTASPETEVAIRMYPDGNVNSRLTTSQWMAKYKAVKDAGFWCESTNEDPMLGWYLFIENGKTRLENLLDAGYKILLPAFAVGTPEPHDWLAWMPIIRIVNRYGKDRVRISIHEYYKGSPLVGFNSIQNGQSGRDWTMSTPLPPPPNYLCGRAIYNLKAILGGEPMPAMVMTEFGIGNPTTPNFGTIIPTNPSGLTQYPGGPFANYDPGWGWYSFYNQFKAWYPGYQPEVSYARHIVWFDQVLYLPNDIPIIVYCLGADPRRYPGSEQDWLPFSVTPERWPAFFHVITDYALTTTTIPPQGAQVVSTWIPTTIYPAKPGAANYPAMRSEPSIRGKELTVKSRLKAEMGVMVEVVQIPNTDPGTDQTLSWIHYRAGDTPALEYYSRSDVVSFK